jgi:ATP-dependent DNA helicase UvrD/PcrA
VDEAQDTNPDAWRCIEMPSAYTQIVCLADLEQQIFDHLPGIGPERIEAIKNALNPLPIELGTQNHRSPNSEIVLIRFAGPARTLNLSTVVFHGRPNFPRQDAARITSSPKRS